MTLWQSAETLLLKLCPSHTGTTGFDGVGVFQRQDIHSLLFAACACLRTQVLWWTICIASVCRVEVFNEAYVLLKQPAAQGGKVVAMLDRCPHRCAGTPPHDLLISFVNLLADDVNVLCGPSHYLRRVFLRHWSLLELAASVTVLHTWCRWTANSYQGHRL